MQDAVHILYDHVPHFVGRVAQSVWVPDRITVGTGFSTQPPVEWVPGRAADRLPPSNAAVIEEYRAIPRPTTGTLYLYVPHFIQF